MYQRGCGPYSFFPNSDPKSTMTYFTSRSNDSLCVQNGKRLNPLYTGNPITAMFTNSEDPDEVQHNDAFHQGLHCL